MKQDKIFQGGKFLYPVESIPSKKTVKNGGGFSCEKVYSLRNFIVAVFNGVYKPNNRKFRGESF